MSARDPCHVLIPPELGGDGDECACGVRLSQYPWRDAAARPTDVVCATCVLRVLREWQKDPAFDMERNSSDREAFLTRWPWEKA